MVYALDPETPNETVYEPITAEAMKALNAQEDNNIPDKSSTINAVH